MNLPRSATLKKYGLSEKEWIDLYLSQDGKCPICGRVLENGRTVIEHQHIKGWTKLPPEEKKKYVRGITDWYCNYFFLAKGMTLEKSQNISDYLLRFEKRLQEQK